MGKDDVPVSKPQDLMRWAKGYASRGAFVFPCHLNKKPMTPHGFKDAKRDKESIERWWTQTPDASIGIACGASRWFVLDIDADKGGFDSFLDLQMRDVLTLDDLSTFCTRTGSGGLHYIWTMPDGVTLGNSAGKLGTGLDTRGDGGYIIVPPSDHPSGNAYSFELNHPPRDMPLSLIPLLQETPSAPMRAPVAPPKYLHRTLQRAYDRVAGASQGVRNETLNRAGFYLFGLVRDRELPESEVREVLFAAALRAGLEQKETLATIQSAYRGAMAL